MIMTIMIFSLESTASECSRRSRRESSRRESIPHFIYRKISTISLRGSQSSASTIPVSQNCQFKMVTRTVKPEVTVAFMIVGNPDYLLSAGKAGEMFGEKMTNDRKFCE